MTPRILLFTGKGGVGKTSLAAAHALASAASGRETMLISLDQAHNLGDLFETGPCPHPTRVADHLDLLEIDPAEVRERDYPHLVAHLASTLGAGYDAIDPTVQTLPGLDNLFFLLKVFDLAQAGTHERLVLDCAPTGETIALLELPEQLAWYIERYFGLGKAVVRVLAPISQQLWKVQLPSRKAVGEIEVLLDRLLATQALLKDAATTSVRLVTAPEKMVVDETRRTYMYLNLFGYTVDGVIVNNVYPRAEVSAFFDAWIEAQDRHLAELTDSFGHLPMTVVRRYPTDLQGVPALERLARDAVPADAFEPAEAVANEAYAKSGEDYTLTLRTPFAPKEEIDLFHSASELTVRVGTFRRKVMLPDALRHHDVAGARRVDDALTITFRPKGTTDVHR